MKKIKMMKKNKRTDMDNMTKEGRANTRYPKRNRSAENYSDYMLYQTTCEPSDPKTLEEAMKRDDSTQWKEAMKVEPIKPINPINGKK